MENEVVDNQQTEVTDTNTAPETTETPTQQTEQAYTPFAQGKEKFKVNGTEEEWDWETTRKYAQLGKAGQRAMERAAELEKSYKGTYAQLVQAAERDLPGLYEALTGKKYQANQRAPQQGTPEGQQIDPRDQMLHATRQELDAIKQQLEQRAIDDERKLIETELSDAIKKYPSLDNPIYRSHVKQEYARALSAGITDLTLEDAAFLVNEQVRQLSQQKATTVQNKFEENKKKAPIQAPPPAGKESKGMTLEDVKRLAGRV